MFGPVKVTKDPFDSSNNKYSGYRICLDEGSDFSFGNIICGKNIIIFGVDMSFSSLTINRANNTYVLGKDFIQGINGTTIYAEKLYKHNFTASNKKLVLSLHYYGDDSYLLVNDGEELKFKAQAFSSEIEQNIMCIGNLSSDWGSVESTY